MKKQQGDFKMIMYSKNKKIIFLAVLLSLLIFCGCGKRETVASKGIVNGVIGSVIIKQNNKTSQAKVGDFIVAGMTIEVGEKSLMDIHLNKNMIRLFENTVIFIDTLDLNAVTDVEQTELNLEKGEVLSKIAKKMTENDSFRVRTPTTVAAVRGTEFSVLMRDDKVKVSCISGKVRVANTTLVNKKGEYEFVEVPANKEVQVVVERPLEVTIIPEENRKRMENIFADISSSTLELKPIIIENTEPQTPVIKKQTPVRQTTEQRNLKQVDQKGDKREP